MEEDKKQLTLKSAKDCLPLVKDAEILGCKTLYKTNNWWCFITRQKTTTEEICINLAVREDDDWRPVKYFAILKYDISDRWNKMKQIVNEMVNNMSNKQGDENS